MHIFDIVCLVEEREREKEKERRQLVDWELEWALNIEQVRVAERVLH